MNDPAYSVVYATMSPTEADMMVAVLRGAGFHPLDLPSDSGCYSMSGSVVLFSIRVPTCEVDEARALLDAYDEPHPNA